jgi:hypothetical protein
MEVGLSVILKFTTTKIKIKKLILPPTLSRLHLHLHLSYSNDAPSIEQEHEPSVSLA